MSIGSINPHWDEFNKRGPTTFALESIGKLIFLKCDIKVYQLKRFKSWTAPRRFVWASEPQLPLNAFLNPCSTILSLKKDFIFDSIRPIKLSLYLLSWLVSFSFNWVFFFRACFSFLDNVSSSL